MLVFTHVFEEDLLKVKLEKMAFGVSKRSVAAV